MGKYKVQLIQVKDTLNSNIYLFIIDKRFRIFDVDDIGLLYGDYKAARPYRSPSVQMTFKTLIVEQTVMLSECTHMIMSKTLCLNHSR